MAPGTVGEPQTLERSLEDESRRGVSKEATVKTGGLSLVQDALQERMAQTSTTDKLYWFPVVSLVEGGRERQSVCVKNVMLTHVLSGTRFFGIENKSSSVTPWPFIVINPI